MCRCGSNLWQRSVIAFRYSHDRICIDALCEVDHFVILFCTDMNVRSSSRVSRADEEEGQRTSRYHQPVFDIRVGETGCLRKVEWRHPKAVHSRPHVPPILIAGHCPGSVAHLPETGNRGLCLPQAISLPCSQSCTLSKTTVPTSPGRQTHHPTFSFRPSTYTSRCTSRDPSISCTARPVEEVL